MRRAVGRRRAGQDAGVSQSAFLALLIVIILVVTSTLVAYGPKVGGILADYWICQLAGGSDQACTRQQDQPGPGGTDNGNPHGQVSAWDLDQFAEDTGVDPDELPASVQQGQNTLVPLGMDVCQLAAIYADGYGDLLPPVQPEQEDGMDCGSSISNEDGELTVTVPDDEVHTDLWRWVIQLVAGAAAVTGGLLAFGVCDLVTGPAAAGVCPYVGGFFIGFIYSFAGQLIGGNGITDWDTWVSALVTGLLSAIPAAYGKAWPVIKKVVPKIIKALGNGIAKGLSKLGGWAVSLGRKIGAGFDSIYQKVVDALKKEGPRIPPATADCAAPPCAA